MKIENMTAVKYEDQWILRSRGKTIFGNRDYKFALSYDHFETEPIKKIREYMTEEYQAEYVSYKPEDNDAWGDPVIMLVTFPTRKLASEAADYVVGLAMVAKMNNGC